MPTRNRVIIVGCGIAGPVLAIFLKLKGYEPVIYERIKRDTDAGLSLLLQANGLRVLNLVPELIERIVGQPVNGMAYLSTVFGDEGVIGEAHFPTGGALRMIGVERHKFLQVLTQSALDHGVEIHWEQKIVDLEQGHDFVTVKFESGQTDTASFVVGCDGLHSNTRISLFGNEEATYTGLTQVGGLSKTPDNPTFKEAAGSFQIFGDGAHIITYPISETHYSWALTRREAEHKETWRAVDLSTLESVRQDVTGSWGFGVGDLIKNAEKVVKYGLYDRPELKEWHRGRVVLLGDAAHPTSPHIGQGANQAFEDVYHLVRVLQKLNSEGSPSTEALTKAFAEYQSIRLTRTSELVKEARRTGETRTAQGLENAKRRNQGLREVWQDKDNIIAYMSHLASGPFVGESEI
ncbi:hypothetical protein C8J56DRAFT_1002540 [Mycena floridula]|nr:hypothetical protein C8J56DRAFT_1002540 [Mycena floridula]